MEGREVLSRVSAPALAPLVRTFIHEAAEGSTLSCTSVPGSALLMQPAPQFVIFCPVTAGAGVPGSAPPACSPNSSQRVLGCQHRRAKVGPSAEANAPLSTNYCIAQPALRGRQCASANAGAGRSAPWLRRNSRLDSRPRAGRERSARSVTRIRGPSDEGTCACGAKMSSVRSQCE